MKIGIITDSIRQQPTGIGNYAKDITEKLIHYDNHNIYSYIDYQENSFNNKKLIKITNPFKLWKTYLWYNYIPLKSKEIYTDVLLNITGVPHYFTFKKKEILFVYDISWYLFPQYHRFSRVFYYKMLFQRNIKKAYKIVTISENTKKDLIKFFKVESNRILVIYPNVPKVNNPEKKPLIKLPQKYILYVGTLEPRKNVKSIIKAFSYVKNKDCSLLITGKNGWKYKDIYELIKKLNLDKKIVFTGYITDEEKKYLYKHAKLFIYPSLYEGFGIPPLEAMSYGCPVITSDVSSLPEVVGNAGVKVNPKNIKDMTLQIDRILNDSSFKKEL